MNKELDEKRRLLDSILEQKKKMETQQTENLQLLNEYLSVKDAYQLYQQGELSEADTLSISGAWGLPMGILKILLAILAGYAFLFTWGAFDAALAFYPEDAPGDSVPSKDTADDPREDQIKSQ